MPYLIVKRAKEARLYKIVKRNTGEIVGSSKTLADAKASILVRYMGEHSPNRLRKR